MPGCRMQEIFIPDSRILVSKTCLRKDAQTAAIQEPDYRNQDPGKLVFLFSVRIET